MPQFQFQVKVQSYFLSYDLLDIFFGQRLGAVAFSFYWPKKGFDFRTLLFAVSFACAACIMFFPMVLCGQSLPWEDGFNFADNVDVTKPWNALNEVPLSSWLTHAQTPNERMRLKCMGNIVVPIQAYQASRMLARMEPLML